MILTNVLCALLALFTAQDPLAEQDRAPLPEATRLWLDEHAFGFDSLDLAADTADLEPLRAALADKRIVLLGEQSHTDGASFAAKARLVRYLHEEMGFEVLAFESGLYECDRANRLLEAGEIEQALDQSVFRLWRVGSVRAVYESIAASLSTDKPMRLAGFDIRRSGGRGERLFDEAVQRANIQGASDTRSVLTQLETALRRNSYKPKASEREQFLEALSALTRAYDQWLSQESDPTRDDLFLARCLENYRVRELFEYTKKQRTAGRWQSTNIRDAQMASNLLWLAEVAYPQSKIVCWGATMHFMRDVSSIRDEDGEPYAGCKPMGTHLSGELGSLTYSVGFAAHHGTRGMPGAREFKLPEWPADGIEDSLWRYGSPLLFVDLSAAGPLDERRPGGLLGYSQDHTAVWSDVVDALVFTETMFPATR